MKGSFHIMLSCIVLYCIVLYCIVLFRFIFCVFNEYITHILSAIGEA